MPRLLALLFAAVLMASLPGRVEALFILSPGVSCGKWVADRDRDGKPQRWWLNWVGGYLSGLAWGRQQDVLKGTDLEALALWMDNYCRSNPLKSIDEAADDLYDELMRRHK